MKSEDGKTEAQDKGPEVVGDRLNLDEAFRRVAAALEGLERDTRRAPGRRLETVTKEVKKPKQSRGRKKSLVVEDPSTQPSESDLSDLFGIGLTPEDGSSRSSGYQSGERPQHRVGGNPLDLVMPIYWVKQIGLILPVKLSWVYHANPARVRPPSSLTMTDSESETCPEAGGSEEASLSMFWDEVNPLGKDVHPALPTILEEKAAENKRRGHLTPHTALYIPSQHLYLLSAMDDDLMLQGNS